MSYCLDVSETSTDMNIICGRQKFASEKFSIFSQTQNEHIFLRKVFHKRGDCLSPDTVSEIRDKEGQKRKDEAVHSGRMPQ